MTVIYEGSVISELAPMLAIGGFWPPVSGMTAVRPHWTVRTNAYQNAIVWRGYGTPSAFHATHKRLFHNQLFYGGPAGRNIILWQNGSNLSFTGVSRSFAMQLDINAVQRRSVLPLIEVNGSQRNTVSVPNSQSSNQTKNLVIAEEFGAQLIARSVIPSENQGTPISAFAANSSSPLEVTVNGGIESSKMLLEIPGLIIGLTLSVPIPIDVRSTLALSSVIPVSNASAQGVAEKFNLAFAGTIYAVYADSSMDLEILQSLESSSSQGITFDSSFIESTVINVEVGGTNFVFPGILPGQLIVVRVGRTTYK